MKARGPKKLHAEQTRARIQESATRLFVTQGFSASSIAQIAKAADVTGGALYAHFPSKEALLLSLLKRWEEDFLDVLIAGTRCAPGNALDKLHKMVSLGAAFAAEQKDISLLLAIVSADLHGAGNAIGAELRRLNETHVRFVSDLVADGQTEGVIDPSFDTRTLARVIVAFYEGVLLQWQRTPGEAEGRELVKTLRKMLVRGCTP